MGLSPGLQAHLWDVFTSQNVHLSCSHWENKGESQSPLLWLRPGTHKRSAAPIIAILTTWNMVSWHQDFLRGNSLKQCHDLKDEEAYWKHQASELGQQVHARWLESSEQFCSGLLTAAAWCSFWIVSHRAVRLVWRVARWYRSRSSGTHCKIPLVF